MVLKQIGIQFDTEEIRRFEKLLPNTQFSSTARKAFTEFLDKIEAGVED